MPELRRSSKDVVAPSYTDWSSSSNRASSIGSGVAGFFFSGFFCDGGGGSRGGSTRISGIPTGLTLDDLSIFDSTELGELFADSCCGAGACELCEGCGESLIPFSGIPTGLTLDDLSIFDSTELSELFADSCCGAGACGLCEGCGESLSNACRLGLRDLGRLDDAGLVIGVCGLCKGRDSCPKLSTTCVHLECGEDSNSSLFERCLELCNVGTSGDAVGGLSSGCDSCSGTCGLTDLRECDALLILGPGDVREGGEETGTNGNGAVGRFVPADCVRLFGEISAVVSPVMEE